MSCRKPLNPVLRAVLSGLTLAAAGTLCAAGVLYLRLEILDPYLKERSAWITPKLETQFNLLFPPEALGRGAWFRCHTISHELTGPRMRLYTSSKDGRIAGYVMTYATSRGYSNPLILIAGFDRQKNVYRVDLEFTQETPGIGDQIERRNSDFLDALSGRNLENTRWDLTAYGGDFDFIAGATVTSRAVVLATADALTALRETDAATLPDCSQERRRRRR